MGHSGGWPCIPPVVAGWACDERRGLGSFRPSSSSSGQGREEGSSSGGQHRNPRLDSTHLPT